MVRVSDRELAGARVSRRVEIEPVHTSIIGAGRPGNVRPPERVVNREGVARHTPPASERFDRQPNTTRPGREAGSFGQPSRPVTQPAPVYAPPSRRYDEREQQGNGRRNDDGGNRGRGNDQRGNYSGRADVQTSQPQQPVQPAAQPAPQVI